MASLVGVSLDPDDERPPYEQVASILRDAIRQGDLRPGDRLPGRAALATEHGVSHMTIQSAIRALREEGLVVARQGSGVFVRTEPLPRPVPLAEIQRLADVIEHDPGYSAMSGAEVAAAVAARLRQVGRSAE
jgi:DNA-binding GntR family transcriptional regulator